MSGLLDLRCPFCGCELTLDYVGSHWRYACMNPQCLGHCEITGKSRNDIEQRLNVDKGGG